VDKQNKALVESRVRRVFSILVLLCSVTAASFAWADGCRNSISVLSGASGGEPVSREVLMGEMAELFSAVLQDPSMNGAFLERLRVLAGQEGRSPESLFSEIETLSLPSDRRKILEEERRERIQVEEAHMFEGLEPYLQNLSGSDRAEITNKLILPGLVKPIITGEVEFHFRGRHEFELGKEDLSGGNQGKIEKVSFSSGNDFAMGQVPVTQLLYLLAALNFGAGRPAPSHFKEGKQSVVLQLGGQSYVIQPNHPVEKVLWDEAMAHTERVSKLTGAVYGLPNDKQWEFANRAGSAAEYHFGNDERLLPNYAWFSGNSLRKTHPVGELWPNDFGLFDTHGNVNDWTSTPSGAFRVVRGGSFASAAHELRSAYFRAFGPPYSSSATGFRLERRGPSYTVPTRSFTFGTVDTERRSLNFD
jgi:hypothetical protein